MSDARVTPTQVVPLVQGPSMAASEQAVPFHSTSDTTEPPAEMTGFVKRIWNAAKTSLFSMSFYSACFSHI